MLCRQPRANINGIDSEGRTALMYSVEHSHYDCCEALIANKPDLALADNYGCNALHYATLAEKPNVFIVRLLCQNGKCQIRFISLKLTFGQEFRFT